MRISADYSPARGQTSLEYLLLLGVVAVVVIAAFGPGSLVDKVRNSAQDYYNSVTRVIMGEKPQPIDGGWCPVANPPAGSFGPTVMYRSCECPAPAFGGTYCSGNGNCPSNATCNEAQVTFNNVTACGPCPAGQVCLAPDGHCGCPNTLKCGSGNGPTGSIPSTDCTQCICPSGTTYNATTRSCDQICTTPCTTWNGTACVAVTCAANMHCDTAQPAATECQCDKGAYYVGPGCAYCPQCQTSYDAKTCVDASATICPPSGNWSCSPTAPVDQVCQCWTNYCWNGSTCAWTGHSCS